MSTPTRPKEEKPLFIINDLKIYPNRYYRAIDKPDSDAPSGFSKLKISKLPSAGIDESFPFNFVTTPGSTRGLFDTGFYAESPCYRSKDKSEIAEMVKSRKANVLKPYQEATGELTALENTNIESLDATQFNIYSGKMYYTGNALEVMDLYAALISREACPEHLKGSATYSNTYYMIEDITSKSTSKKTEDSDIMVTASKFMFLYQNDPERLNVVLKWTEIGKYPKNADETTMQSIFFQSVKDNDQRRSAFLKAVEESSSEGYLRDKMYVYDKLLSLVGKDDSISTASNGKIFYDEVEIGNDLRSASENIAKNPDLKTIKIKVLASK